MADVDVDLQSVCAGGWYQKKSGALLASLSCSWGFLDAGPISPIAFVGIIGSRIWRVIGG